MAKQPYMLVTDCRTTPTTIPSCTLNSASITPNCNSGASLNCEVNEIISMTASYSGDCDRVSYFQIDAKNCVDNNNDNLCDADGVTKVCDIQYTVPPGDISGISSSALIPFTGTITGTWTISSIPVDCLGKKVYAYAAGLYDLGPPPDVWISGKTDTVITNDSPVGGSFIFNTVECTTATDCKGSDGTYATYCPKDSIVPNYILPRCDIDTKTCQCAGTCGSATGVNSRCASGYCCTGENPQGPNIILPGKTDYTCEPKSTVSNLWLCT